jgi:HD superfamily phosphodiesterase
MKSPDKSLQLASLVDLSKPRRVLADSKKLFRYFFPARSFTLVERAFSLTAALYAGNFPGYRRCNVEYHDFFHTLTVFSAASRIMDGCILSGMDLRAEEAGEILIAALLHDSGYIQETEDATGTGAKHTRIHVDRSAAFVIRHAADFGLDPGRASSCARLILGTDLARAWDKLEFRDAEEKRSAKILSAADILGQMADRAYLEKLLFLYHEFREAGFEGYATAFDILKKTAAFYDSTKLRLDGTLGEVSHKAEAHFARRFGIEADLYREAIARHMAYLASILADDKVNFRKKLKRLDLDAIEREREAG